MHNRPLWVWVLCLGNGLFAAFLIGASLIAEDRGYAPWSAMISGLCGFGLSLSAHAAWFGYKLGRDILLGLLSLFLGLIIFQSVQTLLWAAETGTEGPLPRWAFTRLCLSLLWLAINYYGLLGSRMRTFFR